MLQFLFIVVVIIGTVTSYLLARALYSRIHHPLLLPIIVATVLIICVLALFGLSYDTYMIGGKYMHALLGPVVVALAYPLYIHRKLLIQLALPILVGSFIGAVIGISTGVSLAKLFQINEKYIYSLLPKSVTTPVAMDISETLGGISSLAATFVTIAGVSGATLSEFIFRRLRIKSDVGRGVALGSASHAIGTAKAFERSHLTGSVSTIAMIVSAIFVSILTPIFIRLLM